MPDPEHICVLNNIGPIGGVDTDVVEMELYDSFRELDREPITLKYLMKCREKPISKTREYREMINKLQKDVDRVKLEGKEENERI